MSVVWSTLAQLMIIFFSRFPVMMFGSPGTSNCHTTIILVKSSSLLLHIVLKRDLFINYDDSLMS